MEEHILASYFGKSSPAYEEKLYASSSAAKHDINLVTPCFTCSTFSRSASNPKLSLLKTFTAFRKSGTQSPVPNETLASSLNKLLRIKNASHKEIAQNEHKPERIRSEHLRKSPWRNKKREKKQELFVPEFIVNKKVTELAEKKTLPQIQKIIKSQTPPRELPKRARSTCPRDPYVIQYFQKKKLLSPPFISQPESNFSSSSEMARNRKFLREIGSLKALVQNDPENAQTYAEEFLNLNASQVQVDSEKAQLLLDFLKSHQEKHIKSFPELFSELLGAPLVVIETKKSGTIPKKIFSHNFPIAHNEKLLAGSFHTKNSPSSFFLNRKPWSSRQETALLLNKILQDEKKPLANRKTEKRVLEKIILKRSEKSPPKKRLYKTETGELVPGDWEKRLSFWSQKLEDIRLKKK